MNSHPTLDLAPIGVVALVGLALALLPVVWLWRRQRTDGGDWRRFAEGEAVTLSWRAADTLLFPASVS